MAKKSKIRAEDITEKEILSLYEKSLSRIYTNSEETSADDELDNWLLHFVPYDSYYFISGPGENSGNIITVQTEIGKDFSDISIKSTPLKDLNTIFDEVAENTYKIWINRAKKNFPNKRLFDHYRISLREEPQVMAGFFRFFDEREDKSFTAEEKLIFEKTAPHIFALIRTSHSFKSQSKEHQYFKTYAEICSRLATDYKLSETEYKIMIELLSGKPNEEIAVRNFISLATVKTHIQHILNKTHTKSRMDFIGKFFTSPERVDM